MDSKIDQKEVTGSYVKILFRFFSGVLDEWTVETMWATVIDLEKGLYKLDNIPFYAPSIACGDIVFAEYVTDEQFLTFRDLATPSGNSTVQVVLMEKSVETNEIRSLFDCLGCSSEKGKEGYFVVDVPASISYPPVRSLLIDLSGKGLIDYAESCLSEKHDYRNG